MVYLFTFFGFAMGFGVGLGTINVILRHKTMDEIESNRSLRFWYGLLVWVFALAGGWAGWALYTYHFA
jgi:hypothetical protein